MSNSASLPPPGVSLVVPTYNCLALTQAFHRSLLATLPKDTAWELIYVDDGSTDGTRDWLASIANETIRVLLNERNLGYAAANNRAVALSRAPLLALLNNDLVLTPGWLEPMLSALRLPHVGIVGNVQFAVGTKLLDHAGIHIDAKARPTHVRVLSGFTPEVTYWPAVTGACCLLKRETWDTVGGFDERFQNGGEDVDFCLKLAAHGLRCAVANRSKILHHVSSSPNRKLRDEHNSFRLTRAWRAELARLALPARTRQITDLELDAALAFDDPAEAIHLTAFRLGLVRLPPCSAVRAVETALLEQEQRWRGMGLA
ncbi:MAG: glycosyltransferase family 2 protein [Opitutaceae bacterium]|nr:glycosyltransferase family 2 protein [Opitutaceae bacterium]